MSTLRARALQVQRQEWALSLEQPFMLLTCDGCGHCGAGVGVNQSVAIVEQMVSYLTGWGIAARTPHYYEYESSSHDEYENPQRAQWRQAGIALALRLNSNTARRFDFYVSLSVRNQ